MEMPSQWPPTTFPWVMSQVNRKKAGDPFEGFLGDLDSSIERNEAAVTGATQFARARQEWNDAIAQEQMCIPIERLLSEKYFWGTENIWPAVREEIEEIWHARCDFDVCLLRGEEILKRETIYALSYDHADQIARERWPRLAEDSDKIFIRRDRDLHSVIIETPKGTGKDYEAAMIVALIVREYLIQPREDLRRLYNVDPTTTISINLMNRSEDQAKKVTFTEVLKRVNNDFFQDYFPAQVSLADIESSGRMPQDLKFPKNVVVFPGTGSASTGLGYSLGAEIIDECNFMQISDTSSKSIFSGQDYDAAEEAYDDAIVRHRSRFGTFRNGVPVCAGLIVAISSTRLTTDFTQRMRVRAQNDTGIFYSSSAFWHRKPVPLSGQTFQFDLGNLQIIDLEGAKLKHASVKKLPTADLEAA